MRMPMRASLCALAALFVSGCADPGPEIKAESILVQQGQSIVVDNAGNEPRISIKEDGRLFTRSEVFPGRADMSDLSGIRKVYIFVPEKYLAAANTKTTTVTKADGLQAFEYSKNDASPEDYCFQELSEGSISVRVANGNRVVIESRLKTPIVTGPTDARCDSPGFSSTVDFSL